MLILEICLIVFVSTKIARLIRRKGRNPAGYIVLFVVLWLLGEMVGFAVALAIESTPNAGRDGSSGINFNVYLLALICAATGGMVGYCIAKSVSTIDASRRRFLQNFSEQEYESRRARRRFLENYDEKEYDSRREARPQPDGEPRDGAFEEHGRDRRRNANDDSFEDRSGRD